jgi:hypothetical protein
MIRKKIAENMFGIKYLRETPKSDYLDFSKMRAGKKDPWNSMDEQPQFSIRLKYGIINDKSDTSGHRRIDNDFIEFRPREEDIEKYFPDFPHFYRIDKNRSQDNFYLESFRKLLLSYVNGERNDHERFASLHHNGRSITQTELDGEVLAIMIARFERNYQEKNLVLNEIYMQEADDTESRIHYADW